MWHFYKFNARNTISGIYLFNFSTQTNKKAPDKGAFSGAGQKILIHSRLN